MKKVRAKVSGLVQGVWFRATTRDKARELGLHGYVRNLANGNVEFVAEGEDAKVDELVEWAKKGPPMANVQDVKVDVLEYNNEYSDFEIAY
ncbi:MAG: acylphosphatase [bacterium]|nr:MAG: acylphosphatase [bacterium]